MPAPKWVRTFDMVRTSRTSGTLIRAQVPLLNRVEARIGSAAFLAPLMLTSPARRRPPEMTMQSIRQPFLQPALVRRRPHPSGTQARGTRPSVAPGAPPNQPGRPQVPVSDARPPSATTVSRSGAGGDSPARPFRLPAPRAAHTTRLPAAASQAHASGYTADWRR